MDHYFLYGKKGKQTKISNKANTPCLFLYLDSLGNVIERVGFGKHRNTDLSLLDFLERNKFEKGKLTSTIKYHTNYDCQRNGHIPE